MIDLEDPKEFDSWWSDQINQKKTPEQSVEFLQALGDSPIINLRIGLVGFPISDDFSRQYITKSLLSSNKTIEIFAYMRLAWIDLINFHHSNKSQSSSLSSLLEYFHSLRRNVDQLEQKSNLTIDLIARLQRSIAECYYLMGKFHEAKVEITPAILLAQGIQINLALSEFKVFQLRLFYYDGQLNHALNTSEIYMDELRANESRRHYVATIHGLTLLHLGDDDAALNFFLSSTESSNYPNFLSLLEVCLLRSGRGGDIEPEGLVVLPHVTNETSVHSSCDRILLKNNGRPNKNQLRQVHQIISESRHDSNWTVARDNYYRAYASLKLNDFMNCYNYLPGESTFSAEFYGLKLQIILLKLELFIVDKNPPVFDVAVMVADLFDFFNNLPPRIQKNLALRVRMFFPYATAFLSRCPFDFPEIKAVCVDSIIEIGNKIFVFGKQIQPILAGCVLLDDFHCSYRKKLNEVQMRQEQDIFLQGVSGGLRKHWYKPVSAGFLIFQYLRVHEQIMDSAKFKHPSLWSRVANELSHSHGIMPHPRGFETEKRQKIEHLLEQMLKGNVLPSEFYALLDMDNKLP